VPPAPRGVTASAISHAVSNLEARVGLRLLNRTTRSVSLTDAGAMLLSQISPAFGESSRGTAAGHGAQAAGERSPSAPSRSRRR
jgi:DNA-binding transcriptional LysR family regulator